MLESIGKVHEHQRKCWKFKENARKINRVEENPREKWNHAAGPEGLVPGLRLILLLIIRIRIRIRIIIIIMIIIIIIIWLIVIYSNSNNHVNNDNNSSMNTASNGNSEAASRPHGRARPRGPNGHLPLEFAKTWTQVPPVFKMTIWQSGPRPRELWNFEDPGPNGHLRYGIFHMILLLH